jgi:phosphatidylglycerophosphatase A
MPGTYGSLLGALIWWILLAGTPTLTKIIAVATLLLLGTGIVRSTCISREVEDDQAIVLDEITGLWIALLFLPSTLGAMALGLILFRIFDIWKPWPISWADREIKGSLGIMLDDVIAGVFALLVFHGVRDVIKILV